MSTKPGIPDHFTIHDVREHVARIFPDSATAAHHAADTDDETLKARAVRGIRDESVTMDPKTQGALSKGLLPLTKPHVATLPDGRAVDLPAGTVLREGMTWDGPPADPLRDLCDAFKANPDPATAAMISKLREQVDRGASPLLAQALDLLRRARPRLVDEPESKRLDGEIVAFLAGMPIVSEGSQPLTLAELCAWATAEAKGIEVTMGDKLDPYLDGKIAALLVIAQFVNEPARLREYMVRRGTVAAAGRATFAQREYTAEENFAALKRMAPSLAGVYERAAAKHGIRPWEATEEMAWEECPNLRPAPK